MIFSQEELQSWVTKNMPTLLRQGLLFNRAVYNEMFLALDASRDDLVAIIPADADNAEDLIHQIFYMNESSQQTTVRCRQRFEGIEVLLANSGFPTGSSSHPITLAAVGGSTPSRWHRDPSHTPSCRLARPRSR